MEDTRWSRPADGDIVGHLVGGIVGVQRPVNDNRGGAKGDETSTCVLESTTTAKF